MKLIDKQLLDDISRQAKQSDRLRMNYNFHQSLDEKCHRFLNAVEPGTKVEIHRHPTKDEDGSIIESVVLCAEEGRYGVNILKGVWHTLESLESGSCIFECKEGPFVEHDEEGVLRLQP